MDKMDNMNIVEDYDDGILLNLSPCRRSRLICEEDDEIIIKPSPNKRTRLICEDNSQEIEIDDYSQEKNDTEMMIKLIDIYNKNKYKYSNMKDTGKDYNSISFLVNRPLSQSQCIKLGINLEKYLADIILDYNHNLTNIKPDNKNGNKEKDHLFMDKNNKIIYYAEIKSNLNLDTEKSKETANKCLTILKELQTTYTDYTVNMFLVGIRHYSKDLIPRNIMNKYDNIKMHVVGVNEYLSNLNCNLQFNHDNYVKFINIVVDKCL